MHHLYTRAAPGLVTEIPEAPVTRVPGEADRSSLVIINQEKLVEALPSAGVDFILDRGCGVGNDLFALAERYPEAGKLVGVDFWGEGINTLNRKTRERGIPRVMVGPFGFLRDDTSDPGTYGCITTFTRKGNQSMGRNKITEKVFKRSEAGDRFFPVSCLVSLIS